MGDLQRGLVSLAFQICALARDSQLCTVLRIHARASICLTVSLSATSIFDGASSRLTSSPGVLQARHSNRAQSLSRKTSRPRPPGRRSCRKPRTVRRLAETPSWRLLRPAMHGLSTSRLPPLQHSTRRVDPSTMRRRSRSPSCNRSCTSRQRQIRSRSTSPLSRPAQGCRLCWSRAAVYRRGWRRRGSAALGASYQGQQQPDTPWSPSHVMAPETPRDEPMMQ